MPGHAAEALHETRAPSGTDSLISYPDILGLNHESGVLDFLRDYCIGGDSSVRLKIEQNQLVSMGGEIVLLVSGCKAHEIWVFSKIETDKICRQV